MRSDAEFLDTPLVDRLPAPQIVVANSFELDRSCVLQYDDMVALGDGSDEQISYAPAFLTLSAMASAQKMYT